MPLKYQQFYLPISLILLFVVYAVNIGANDVWYPNESFYADSLRNWMEGRGNWFEFWFNDERRFNKPPGTYFFIYISALIFGLNEFALRISMALLAVGSVYYTFKLGDFLYGSKAGWLSGAIMAVSIQFIANIRYATPEIPLCFVFVATMYYFIKAIRTKSNRNIWLAWIFLGLTVLTKGFPYYIVIGGAIVTYFLWSTKSFVKTYKSLTKIKVWSGGILSIIIGMSWPLYSYFVEKDGFIGMYGSETLGRAMDFREYTYTLLTQLKFYPEAMTWAFLPYSVAMYIGLFIIIKNKDYSDTLKFLLSWVAVMYVIFTLSSGKLPTYFIQAHPALSVITAYVILNYKQVFNQPIIKFLSFYLPTILGFTLAFIALYLYKSPIYLYLIPPVFFFAIMYFIDQKEAKIYYAPFASLIPFIFIAFYYILPSMEINRPVDKIGHAISQTTISKDIPIYAHKHRMFNLPYYTGRKLYIDLDDKDVALTIQECSPAIMIVRDSIVPLLPPAKSLLWQGPIYSGYSEAKFLRYFMSNQKAINGNMEDYIDYSILFFDTDN